MSTVHAALIGLGAGMLVIAAAHVIDWAYRKASDQPRKELE
jgi:hypothetical protein